MKVVVWWSTGWIPNWSCLRVPRQSQSRLIDVQRNFETDRLDVVSDSAISPDRRIKILDPLHLMMKHRSLQEWEIVDRPSARYESGGVCPHIDLYRV